MLSGGPRPTNTLDRANGLSNIREKRNTRPVQKQAMRGILQIETVRGDNLQGIQRPPYNSNEYSEPPSAKRRKVEASHMPVRVHGSKSPMSDDSINHCPPDQLQISISKTRSQSPLYQGPLTGAISRYQGPATSVTEYRRTESMMNSGKKTRRQKRQDRRRESQEEDVIMSSSTSTIDEPTRRQVTGSTASDHDDLELLDSDPLFEPSNDMMNEGRQEAEIQNDEGKTSKYFSASERERLFDASRSKVSHGSVVESKLPVGNVSLNKLFIGTNGKHRAVPGALSSPDELAVSETTVGKHGSSQQSSPTKKPRSDYRNAVPTPRQPSPFKTQNAIKSELKTRDPVDTVSNARRKKEGVKAEAPAPWSVGLSMIILSTNTIESNDMALVHEEENDSYKIVRAGGCLSQINPKKIFRIIYEVEGTKMRFESSLQEGTEKAPDIEFASGADLNAFFRHFKKGHRVQSLGKDK